MCFDFANGQASGGINTLDGRSASTLAVSDYLSIGTFKDVVFSFCNNGTDSSTCGFYNTRVSFPTSLPINPYPYLWGIEGNEKERIFYGMNFA